MCGINGVIMLPGYNRTEEQLALIRKIFDEMFVLTDVRGGHASGLVKFSTVAPPQLYKNDCEAICLVHLDTYKEIMDTLSNNTTFIISHTRYATQGSSKNPLNCHPIVAPPIVGVHNGVITNDSKLFDQYKLERHGEVDSEIIFSLLSHMGSQYELSKYVAQRLFGVLRGQAAIAYANIHNPYQIALLRGNNPLSLGYDDNLGVIWFNSLDSLIVKAYLNCQRHLGIRLIDSIETRKIVANTGLIYNLNDKDNIVDVFDLPSLRQSSRRAGFVSYVRSNVL